MKSIFSIIIIFFPLRLFIFSPASMPLRPSVRSFCTDTSRSVSGPALPFGTGFDVAAFFFLVFYFDKTKPGPFRGCSAPIPRNQPSSTVRPRRVPTAVPGPAFREPSGTVGVRLCRLGTESLKEK